jgi:DNA-binding GntR family transcriptional regulator
MSTQQIARLIGYESVVVRSALDRLRREKLVKRSRAVRGGVFTEFWLRQMQAADAALRNSSVCRKVASGDCY